MGQGNKLKSHHDFRWKSGNDTKLPTIPQIQGIVQLQLPWKTMKTRAELKFLI